MAQVSIRTLKKTYDGSDALAVKGINLEIAENSLSLSGPPAAASPRRCG
jgi:ABC-type Fe3+/spermidine/putrescine transport system ATPase subunit